MANTKVTGDVIANGTISTVHLADNAITSDKITGITTAHITEGSNLYYTDTRVRAAISVNGNALSYDSSTGVITSNYEESPTFTGNITFGDSHFIGDDADDNLLIQSSANENIIINSVDDLLLRTSGTTKLIVKNGGNVGIGTSSPSTKLHLGGTAPLDSIIRQDSTVSGTNWEIGERAAGKWQIWEDDTDSVVATFMSTGNVIIGNTNVDNPNSLDKVLEIEHGGSVGLILNDSRDNPIGLENRGAVFHLTHNTNSRLVVDGASGNVGIGTTSPSVKLQVDGGDLRVRDSGNVALQIISSDSNNSAIQFGDDGDTNDGRIVYENTGDNMKFYTLDAEKMLIDSAGNVGIGTSSPQRELHLHTSSSGGSFIAFTNDTTGQTSTDGAIVGIDSSEDLRILQYENKPIRFSTNGSEKMRIDSSGNVGIGTTSPAYKFHVSNNTNGFIGRFTGGVSSDVNIGIFGNSTSNFGSIGTESNDRFSLFTNGVDRLNISNTGNVGIGTTSPSYKLDVESDTDSVAGAYIQAGKSSQGEIQNTGLIVGSRTDIATGDYLGISFSGNSSVPARGRAAIGVISTSGASAMDLVFMTRNAGDGSQLGSSDEKIRITSGGEVLINKQSARGSEYLGIESSGNEFCNFQKTNGARAFRVNCTDSEGFNTSGTTIFVGKNGTTNRSINAGGTINASGADYAEYMNKAIEEDISKGDIVGVNSNGELTNIFNDSISFVVKSTNPSYVGGDTWGVNLEGDALEEARLKVDRIAFSGQVPCNVYEASVGDYIIPINNNGKISAQAISNPTFDEYKLSVGKVWKIMEDGRAWIAVKIA